MIDTIYVGIMAYRRKKSPPVIPELFHFIKINTKYISKMNIVSCEDATDVIMHQLFYILDRANPVHDPEGRTRAEYGLMKLMIETDQPLRYKKVYELEEILKYFVKFYYEDDAGVYFPYLVKDEGGLHFTIPNLMICGSQEEEDTDEDDFGFLQDQANFVDLHLYHDCDIREVFPDYAAKLILSSEFGENS